MADRLFFATGTGIAPFLSALRSGISPPRLLLWGMRHPLTWPEDLSGISCLRCLSRGNAPGCLPGRLTDRLAEIPLRGEPHVYACGLDRMIEQVCAHFTARGLPTTHLHRECFFTGSDSQAEVPGCRPESDCNSPTLR
jgi:ferredoxin-NADP reductase